VTLQWVGVLTHVMRYFAPRLPGAYAPGSRPCGPAGRSPMAHRVPMASLQRQNGRGPLKGLPAVARFSVSNHIPLGRCADARDEMFRIAVTRGLRPGLTITRPYGPQYLHKFVMSINPAKRQLCSGRHVGARCARPLPSTAATKGRAQRAPTTTFAVRYPSPVRGRG
jgi:hypothetical protein